MSLNSEIRTMEKNNEFYLKSCKIIWLLMFVMVVLSVMHGVKLFKYFEMHPQKEYTIDRSNPTLPDEALTKIKLMNIVRFDLGIGLFLLMLYFFCNHKADKKNSYFAGIISTLKKIKIEEE